jgi:hypothetical protein
MSSPAKRVHFDDDVVMEEASLFPGSSPASSSRSTSQFQRDSTMRKPQQPSSSPYSLAVPVHGQSMAYPSPPSASEDQSLAEHRTYLYEVFFPRQVTHSPPYYSVSTYSHTYLTHRTVAAGKGKSTHVVYDIRLPVQHAYVSTPNGPGQISQEYALAKATKPAMTRLRLISRLLPWTIVVENPYGVTFQHVLEAIHQSLQKNVTEGEFFMAPEATRAKMFASLKENTSGTIGPMTKRSMAEGVKRVDYLFEKVAFIGMSRPSLDDEFLKMKVPNKKERGEAWVIHFSSL